MRFLLIAMFLCSSAAFAQQVFSATNLDDTLTNWTICYKPSCDPGGVGTPSPTPTQTINNASPSKDGASMLLSMNGPANTNVLWYYQSGAQNTVTQLNSDFQAYVTGTTIQSVEFDEYQYLRATNDRFMYGTQCVTGGFWQVWQDLIISPATAGTWINTTLPCSFSTSTWHRVQMTAHRVAGETSCQGHPYEYYDTLTIDGIPNVLNMKTCAGTLLAGWVDQTGLNFQLDSNASGGALTMSLDQVSLTGSLYLTKVGSGLSTGSVTIGSGAITGTMSVGQPVYGPPNYLAASILTTDPGVIAPLFASTDPQNTVKEDTTIPGHIAGTEKITRLTSAVTSTTSYQMTTSGGSDDGHISYPNGKYVWAGTTGGTVQPFEVSTASGAVQVVNAGCAPFNLNPGGAFKASRVTETKAYFMSGSKIRQTELSGTGCVGMNHVETDVIDLFAAGVCPGITPFTVVWHSQLAISQDDDSFGISLGPAGGQGFSDWYYVWSRTKGCTAVNFNTGQVYCSAGWGGGCSGGLLGTLDSTVCYGSNGAAGHGIHSGDMTWDGKVVSITTSAAAAGGVWTAGVCAGVSGSITVQMSLWNPGTTHGGFMYGAADLGFGGCCWSNHPSIGLSNTVNGYYGGPNIRSYSNIRSFTQYAARFPVPDLHGTWPHNDAGTYDDLLPWIVQSDSAGTTDGTVGTGGCADAPHCPKYLINVAFAVFPQTAYPPGLPPRVFHHTYECGQAGIAQCPGSVADYFGAVNAISAVSPKGDYHCWASSNLQGFGFDNTGTKYKVEILCAMLQ